MAEKIFLVRHGEYSQTTRGLTGLGREVHAPQARQRLLARGIGEGALILSSAALRAMQTAEIIAEGLPHPNVVSSDLIEDGGNDARHVKDLDDLLARAVAEAQVAVPETGSLVVVTHAPMLAIASGLHGFGDSRKISYGQVMEYEPGSWQNPNFSEPAI